MGKTTIKETASPAAPATAEATALTAEAVAAEVASTSPRAWAVIILSRLQQSTGFLTSLAFGIFLPFIREDLALSNGEVSLLQGVVFGLPMGLGLVVSGPLSRYRPIALLFVSSLVAIPFVALQGWASGFVILMVARLLYAGLSVGSFPAMTLLLQQWVARKDYVMVNAMAMALHSVLMASAFATIPFVIGALGSWRAAFYILAGVMLAELLVWRFLALERKAPVQRLQQALTAQAPNPFLAIKAYPQVWLLGILGFALMAIWAGMITFVPTFLVQERGLSLTYFGVVAAFLYIGLAVASPFADWVGRKVPNRKVLLTGIAVANVAMGVGISVTGSIPLLIVFLFGLGVVWGPFSFVQVLPFEFRGIRPREVAVLTAVMFTCTGVGSAVGPIIAGYAAQGTGSLVTGLLVLCAVSAVGVVAGLLYPARAPVKQSTLEMSEAAVS